jgi:hypothetical protein
VQQGKIQGIHLLGASEPQTVAQFADDTSLTICGDEAPVSAIVTTLQRFKSALGLMINDIKSTAYHWNHGSTT